MAEPPAVGQALPVLRRTLELPDLVAYAGATWDWYRTHYDPEAVRAAQLPAPIVDGQMLGALLAEHAQDWAPPRARLTALEFRFAAMVFAGDTVEVSGTVAEVDGDRVVLDQRVTVGERVAVAPARATLRWPQP